MTSAMAENDVGTLVGIDPVTQAFRAKKSHLHGRYTLLEGRSPEAIPEAVRLLGGPPDFVLIDALHIHDAVLADLRGVIKFVERGAHIALHDAFHPGIREAIRKTLADTPELVDLGFITRNIAVTDPVAYAGIRLLRLGSVDDSEIVTTAYHEVGRERPPDDPALWNYDKFAIRVGLVKQPEGWPQAK